MRSLALLLIALLVVSEGRALSQTDDILAVVRAAVATGGIVAGQKTLDQHRTIHGVTPPVIEALAWLAGEAFAANKLIEADRSAAEAHNLALAAMKSIGPTENSKIQAALGLAIEIQAKVLTEQGARSQAVYFLRRELDTYGATPLGNRLATALTLLSLEGRPAPRLDTRGRIGRRVPSLDELKGSVVLMFFWAHWCPDCKAESPTVAKVLEKYRSRGLVIIAPTQRYGYVEQGRAAAPDKELRYIIKVRDTDYSFLRDQPVPIGESNHRQFGVASVPVHVLIDREGIIRVYHPGVMSESELDQAIQQLL